MLLSLTCAAVGMALILAPSRAFAGPANRDDTQEMESAKKLDGEGRNEEAIEAYTEAIRKDPDDMDALFARATVYDRLQLPELADADYDLAVQNAPKSVNAWWKRARNHHAKRRFAEELYDMDVTIRLDSVNPDHYEERASVHSLLGQYELAAVDYMLAIALDPDKNGQRENPSHIERASIYFSLAQIHADLKRYKEAVVDFEHSEADGLPVQPEHGEYLAQLGRWKEAKKIYDQIMRDNPEEAQAPPSLPLFRTQITDGDAPVKSPASDEDAPEYEALYNRAIARLHLKDYPGAEADVDAASKMRPDDPRAYGIATWVKTATGEFNEAREAGLKGLSLDETQVWIRINLAHVYLREGRFEWARSIYLADHGKPEDGPKTRAQRALDDFVEFRAVGINDPNLTRMEAVLRQSMGSPTSPSSAADESPDIPRE